LRTIKGFEHFDESKHCLRNTKPGTGTKDAPRAFSLKLRRTTTGKLGLKSTSYDPEFEITTSLRTAKHVDDINMTGDEGHVDHYITDVEKVFGKCKVTKHQFTNCGVRYTKRKHGDVAMDQDEYIKTLRPIVSHELTGKPPAETATKLVCDQFVSLRGAVAYTVLTQDWIKVYVVSLQRVQTPTNLDVRRLNAVTRKLQREPKTVVFPAMKCLEKCDLHTDSGYRRMTGEADDDVKGYGIRGLNVIRRGMRDDGSGETCHLIDTECQSHKLQIRSSYGAELLAAAHGVEHAFPTIVTLEECTHGVLKPEALKQLREQGGLRIDVTLTVDAESVFKSLTGKDLKAPSEKTLLGHVSWLREMLQLGLISRAQWCDTRDMTADGHTKGCIDRHLLLELMSGRQAYQHPVNIHIPHREADERP